MLRSNTLSLLAILTMLGLAWWFQGEKARAVTGTLWQRVDAYLETRMVLHGDRGLSARLEDLAIKHIRIIGAARDSRGYDGKLVRTIHDADLTDQLMSYLVRLDGYAFEIHARRELRKRPLFSLPSFPGDGDEDQTLMQFYQVKPEDYEGVDAIALAHAKEGKGGKVFLMVVTHEIEQRIIWSGPIEVLPTVQ
jgi:hypothetical protein